MPSVLNSREYLIMRYLITSVFFLINRSKVFETLPRLCPFFHVNFHQNNCVNCCLSQQHVLLANTTVKFVMLTTSSAIPVIRVTQRTSAEFVKVLYLYILFFFSHPLLSYITISFIFLLPAQVLLGRSISTKYVFSGIRCWAKNY